MNQLVPKYYNKFKCIGSECPETCCQGWQITLDKETFNKYQKLDNLNLKKKADKFVKKLPQEIKINNSTKGFFAEIKMQEGTCPFLGGDKLCSVQKEYGNSYLSPACSQYPRKLSIYNEKKIKTLGLGCPESTRLILFSEDSMNIIEDKLYSVKRYIKLYDDRNISETKILGEKIFNLCFSLMKNKKFPIISTLCVVKKLLEEKKNLEFFPEKLETIYNYLCNHFKNDNFLQFDNASLILEFLREFYVFAIEQNNNAKESSKKMSKNFINVLQTTFETLVDKSKNLEDQYGEFSNTRTNCLRFLRNEYPQLFRNYFLNEILTNCTMFTSRKAFTENRLEVSLLGAIIPQLLIIGQFSKNNHTISQDDISRAFYLTHKNIGFFTKFTGNFEFTFRKRLSDILKVIDDNSSFNSLLLLFA